MHALLSRHLPRQRLARIGFALDATGIACAQLRRTDDGWQLAAGRVIPREPRQPTDEPSDKRPRRSGLEPPLPPEYLLASAGMSGPDTAAVLPMDCCALRVLELPGETDEELRAMLQNEIADEDGGRDVFGFWKLPARMSHHEGLHTVCAISARRESVDEAAAALRSSGFNVVGIDGLPTAMARAVALMPGSEHESERAPTLAIHIGWNACTTVFVRQGRPSLARVPRAPGMEQLVAALAARLELSAADVLRMIRGIQSGLPVRPSDRCLQLLLDEVERWSQPLCEEILRGVTYSAEPGCRAFPAAAVLMGPGCALPGLETLVEHQLNLTACEWSLPMATPTSLNAVVPGELAVAAAASAWEVP